MREAVQRAHVAAFGTPISAMAAGLDAGARAQLQSERAPGGRLERSCGEGGDLVEVGATALAPTIESAARGPRPLSTTVGVVSGDSREEASGEPRRRGVGWIAGGLAIPVAGLVWFLAAHRAGEYRITPPAPARPCHPTAALVAPAAPAAIAPQPSAPAPSAPAAPPPSAPGIAPPATPAPAPRGAASKGAPPSAGHHSVASPPVQSPSASPAAARHPGSELRPPSRSMPQGSGIPNPECP